MDRAVVEDIGLLYYPYLGMMMRGGLVRLQLPSQFDLLDLVQAVSDRLGHLASMDDDTIHWIGVAVRESVINAIKHGNRSDASKLVFVDFETATSLPELTIRVRDQGDGFDPGAIADPLAPENLLKSSGRGIFLIRSFMDDVQLQRAPEGGMEIRMIKRIQPAGAPDQTAKA